MFVIGASSLARYFEGEPMVGGWGPGDVTKEGGVEGGHGMEKKKKRKKNDCESQRQKAGGKP